MRILTQQEEAELSRRCASLETFLEERMPVLRAFMEHLELPNPAMVLVEAEQFLGPLDAWMRDQVITGDDRVWVLTRIGYYVGEYFVQKFSGCWFVNEIPDSRYFSHYVVGQFALVPKANAMLDPFHVASVFVDEPQGRSLSKLLTEVETELFQS